MAVIRDRSHQYRCTIAISNCHHTRHMHDSLKPMFDTLPVDCEIQQPNGTKPVYNVEPLINEQGTNHNIVDGLTSGEFEIWDFDKRNAKLLQSIGLKSTWKPVLLNSGMINWIGEINEDRPIDCVWVGNADGKRKAMIEELQRRIGSGFVWVKDKYGKEATEVLKRSKVALNMHRESHLQAQEQLRIMWAIGCGCMVVSEVSIEPSIPPPIIKEYDLDHLVMGTILAIESWKFSDALRRRTDYMMLSMEYMTNQWGINDTEF